MKSRHLILPVLLSIATMGFSQTGNKALQATTVNGTVEGTNDSGILVFRGIPFAQPPVGELRWKEPQPVKNWQGVRDASKFGGNAMQKKVFGDMNFRSSGGSEDCLYLNVWTAKTGKHNMPVLVYFYGGGYVAGDGSEPRYDGESMARRGIVAVTVNYRLGIFGFFSHPELTKESPHHSSGNYAMLDQNAALEWVKANIAAFGGDPNKVTIAGESAGSISVCAQMASPLSKNLIAGAIGESGGMINPTLPAIPLADAEQGGVAFAKRVGKSSIADLRAMSAEELLDSASKPGAFRPNATIDGYFFPKSPEAIFAAGEQAHVPLMAGWNSAEVPYQFVMGGTQLTPENYAKKIKDLYGDKADEVMKLYPGSTQDELIHSATMLSSDRFIVYSTWKWADLCAQTGGKPVYTYIFGRVRPAMVASMGNAQPGLAGGVVKGDANKPAPKMPPAVGASHASEIEYAMGNLSSNKVYAWTPDDYKVSNIMETYFANFIKTGNPNGNGQPKWEPIKAGDGSQQMHIDVNTSLQPDATRARYLFLDTQYKK